MNNYPDTQNIGSEFIFFPEGRYEQYEKKLQKLVDARNYVIKHKIAFILLGMLFLTLILAFTICRGLFIGGISCPDLTYGDSFSPSANAFFCSVSYEYSSNGSDWSLEEPVLPGEYKVRGVSVNPFGMERRSSSTAFTLYPRSATVSLLDTTAEYGFTSDAELSALYTPEENTAIEGLAEGDRISEIRSSFTHHSWESISAGEPTVRIVNEKDIDVTSSYNLKTVGAEISVYPRYVTVSTVGGEKIYDSLPWNEATYTITEGSLRPNDSFVITFPIFPAEPSIYQVNPEVLRVIDDKGEDVTERYNVTLNVGTLNVKKIPLVFSTPSAEKTYDETPLSLPEWTHESGEPRPNHKLVVISNQDTIANAGSRKNTISIYIQNDLGEDVMNYYDITVKEGTLTIHPIVLKFRTGSAEKVYDSYPLSSPDYEWIEGELLPNHNVHLIKTVGEITDVGTASNQLQVIIYNLAKHDVTSLGYKIEVEEGTLKVTPRPITITSESAEKIYDGTPLTHYVQNITEGSLASGHYINTKFTGTQTEVGESDNTFTVLKILTSIDAAGFFYHSEINIENYKITYVYGTLTVLPNPDYQENTGNGGGNGEGTGGGNQNSGGINTGGTKIEVPPDIDLDNPPIVADITVTMVDKLAFWTYLRAASFGDYNGSGFDAAEVYTKEIGSEYYSPIEYIGTMFSSSYRESHMYINRYEYCPVLVPYYSFGTNNIGGFNSHSDVSFDYSGDSYSINFIQDLDLDDIYGLSPYSEAAKHEQRYKKYVYDTYLQIPDSTKEELLKLAEKNGITEGAYKNQKDLILAIQKYVSNAGVYNLNTAPYPEGVDVAVYFLSTAKEGICQHYAASATMLYRAFGIPARYTVGFAVMARPNATTSVTALNAHAWVEIYLNGKGWVPIEVTGEDSPVRPNKQQITVTSYSITKEYDGQPLGSWAGQKFVISNGKLLPGHTIEVNIDDKHPDAAKTTGTFENTITSVRIYDEHGNDVTDLMYEITLRHGSTVINKRKITIALGSASKVYDGAPLVCTDWTLVSGSIVGGHRVTLSEASSMVEIGVIANIATVNIITPVKYIPVDGIVFPKDSYTTSSSLYSSILLPYKDVTDLYDITIIPGTLEILPEE